MSYLANSEKHWMLEKCDPVCPDGEATSEETEHIPNVKNMRGGQYF